MWVRQSASCVRRQAPHGRQVYRQASRQARSRHVHHDAQVPPAPARRSRRVARTLFGVSAGAAAALVGLPALFWPAVDEFAMPYWCQRAICAAKPQLRGDVGLALAPDEREEVLRRLDAVCAELVELKMRAENRDRVLVVTGDESTRVVSHLLSMPGLRGVGFDMRMLFDQNLYEIGVFRYLGRAGRVLNSYFKGALFISSMLSGRHPHTDGLLYAHNLFNNMAEGLHIVKDQCALQQSRPPRQDGVAGRSCGGRVDRPDRPFFVFDNIDSLADVEDIAHSPETRNWHAFWYQGMTQVSLSWGRDLRRAHVVWAGGQEGAFSVLDKKQNRFFRRHVRVVEVREQDGLFSIHEVPIQDQAQERDTPSPALQQPFVPENDDDPARSSAERKPILDSSPEENHNSAADSDEPPRSQTRLPLAVAPIPSIDERE